jgi:hypothetical protein
MLEATSTFLDSELANAQRTAPFSDYQNAFQLSPKIHYGDKDLLVHSFNVDNTSATLLWWRVESLFSNRLITTRSKVYGNRDTIIIVAKYGIGWLNKIPIYISFNILVLFS